MPTNDAVKSETAAPEAAPKALPCVQLPCPQCGEPHANLSMHLWMLDDLAGPHFHCEECEADFALADVRTFISRWTPFLRWLETVPNIKD